jgi:DNA-directed RNA polymerase specialized sigma24 family protein
MYKMLQYELRHMRKAAPLQNETAGEHDGFLPTVLERRGVAETLARLQPSQARALTLHYLEGRPVREVAEHLQVSEIAAQSLLQRGRHAFRAAGQEERHAFV